MFTKKMLFDYNDCSCSYSKMMIIPLQLQVYLHRFRSYQAITMVGHLKGACLLIILDYSCSYSRGLPLQLQL